ncbi:unnamed protein product [Arabis nemorensis]|uniref:Uncharacterized protein n=1 Tax=Arabis nemorensis TaxID=586526 RepID=A0A565BLV7_9BRAS|nr:unnamed protein product [Arabis nemorensis]
MRRRDGKIAKRWTRRCRVVMPERTPTGLPDSGVVNSNDEEHGNREESLQLWKMLRGKED